MAPFIFESVVSLVRAEQPVDHGCVAGALAPGVEQGSVPMCQRCAYPDLQSALSALYAIPRRVALDNEATGRSTACW